MKRFAIHLIAALVLMLGTAQISHADSITVIINGSSATVAGNNIVVNYQGITVSAFGFDNAPGTSSNAFNTQTNFEINNSGGSGTVEIQYVATDFLFPTGDLIGQVSGSLTSAQLGGGFSYLAQGGADAANLGGLPGGSSASCTIGTTASGSCGPVLFTFSNSGTYSLTTDTVISLGAGAQISGSTSVNLNSSPVPEPASMLLFGTGLMGLAGVIRRKLRK